MSNSKCDRSILQGGCDQPRLLGWRWKKGAAPAEPDKGRPLTSSNKVQCMAQGSHAHNTYKKGKHYSEEKSFVSDRPRTQLYEHQCVGAKHNFQHGSFRGCGSRGLYSQCEGTGNHQLSWKCRGNG